MKQWSSLIRGDEGVTMQQIPKYTCLITLLLVACLLFSATRTALSAEVYGGTNFKEAIIFDGEIDMSSVDKAISLAEQNNARVFYLNSGGGDAKAAMKLGRYFRKKEAVVGPAKEITFVKEDNVCASSCLFLLAGAVYRDFSFARVGAHRAFINKISSSMAESTEDYKQTSNMIREYFREMNVPESLLDIMNSTSPDNVRWLTESEIDFYFPRNDPAYQDRQDSLAAENRGISKAEYILRKQRAEQECVRRNNFPQWAECRKSILDGKR